jgi:hypothetical protein
MRNSYEILVGKYEGNDPGVKWTVILKWRLK